MRFEHAVEIARSPEEVYAYLADPTNLPEWQSEVSGVRRESETRFTEVRTFVGRRIESTLEVTADEPGRVFSLRSVAGPVRSSVHHRLEAAREGLTRLSVVGETEGPVGGLFKLGGPLLKRAAARRFVEDLERPKELLESGR